ncbi:lysylphosphatidylglycerol synthetase-like protein (DUF2156 family) [Microbacterium sp. SORGH_AS 1204]|uniref:hypothetical protein n=1 Tax=Microbacterium sp. SORGH_AS_1204 TaxID=3041785 RepID=UPI0027920358|nr:hypothetical protein [Microbacterium sp. SORGH_AS_1204]MDQ1137440.1 lysylphosphatidylglycerol synthetase-like protein (DUF2156 family) [Microbacterium sp. SORGH_AS_1204]
MSFDVIERFFKLTLDNVYRFVCAVLFIAALWGASQDIRPLRQVARLLVWLGAPSAWLASVETWFAARAGALVVVSVLLLIIAVVFAMRDRWGSRAGATVLLALTALVQAGAVFNVLATATTALVALMIVSLIAAVVTWRAGLSFPEWLSHTWERVGNLGVSIVYAGTAFLSPLGWLLNEDSSPTRGSRWNPVHVKRVDS